MMGMVRSCSRLFQERLRNSFEMMSLRDLIEMISLKRYLAQYFTGDNTNQKISFETMNIERDIARTRQDNA